MRAVSPVTRPARQRGLSIVELLVATAIGLFLSAVGTTLLVSQLHESRSLLVEARLMQDLRTAADLISRDLRRAGYWGAAATGVWTRDETPGSMPVASNPYVALAPGASASASTDAVSFRYSRDARENNAVDTNEQFGFRLRRNVIEMQLGSSNWQALTDANTLSISAFSVTPSVQEIPLANLCAIACPAGSSHCPPRQLVRSLAVLITGRSATNATVVRSVRIAVRVRNDALSGRCA